MNRCRLAELGVLLSGFRRSSRGATWLVLALGSVAACGSSRSEPGAGAGGTGGSNPAGMTGGSSIIIGTGGAAGSGASGGSGAGGGFLTDGGLPPGFTASDRGGFKLGSPVPRTGPVDGGVTGGPSGCGATLVGIIRDMSDAHPDFEDYCCGDTRGAVRAALGVDQKPVYAASGPTFAVGNGPQLMTGATEFDQWYRTVDNVTQPYFIYFFFVPSGGGVFTFHSSSFFPLDGTGWGNQGRNHNFHFATELHTQFRYRGGETFRFTGDDDVWVFVNDRLAIDLGGVHAAENAEVNLDMRAQELGIQTGSVYALDLFHAERHTSESNFRVDTTLEFVNCGIIVR